MSNETSRTGFQLVKDDNKTNTNKTKGLSGDDDIENLMSNAKCILTQKEAFVKDWEVICVLSEERK